MRSVVVLCVVGLWSRFGHADVTGTVNIEIIDAKKSGVAGITVQAVVGTTELTATTGADQPSDTELAAAARQGGKAGAKAVETLNSKANAHAVLADVPLGAVTITLVDVKGAKPLSITITENKTIWNLTATVDAKTKKLIGAPKIVFDAMATAKAQTEAAKAEAAVAAAQAEAAKADAAKSKAAAEQAKAEQEKAKQEQEKAKQEQERAQAKQQESDAAANRARAQAEAERLRRARSEAPSKIAVSAVGCRCTANHTITVTCQVRSTAEVAADLKVSASAETGTFGVNSSGAGALANVAPGASLSFEVLTKFSAFKDCSSCKSSACRMTSVTAK